MRSVGAERASGCKQGIFRCGSFIIIECAALMARRGSRHNALPPGDDLATGTDAPSARVHARAFRNGLPDRNNNIPDNIFRIKEQI